MPNVYAFRSGRGVKNVDPQQVGSELERIRAEKGTLLAADVLEAATDEVSPLHSAFEWEDSAAALQHRLGQARRLIVSVRVLNGPIQPPTQAFISVKTPGKGREYLPAAEALNDEQLKARILDEIRTFVESLERKYSRFSEVAEVLSAMKSATG